MNKLAKEQIKVRLNILENNLWISNIMKYCPSSYGFKDTHLCKEYGAKYSCFGCWVCALKEATNEEAH